MTISSGVKLFITGAGVAALTYASTHVALVIANPGIASIVAGILGSILHSLPSPVASSSILTK